MTLVWPWALLGLLGIPVLVWLDRRRHRPLETTWPSLLLWQGVKEIEAPSKRRIESLLLLECAAVALLAIAAAGPAMPARAEAPLVGVLDTDPAGNAKRNDGRTARAATEAELRRIDPDIEIVNGDERTAAALRAEGKRVVIGTWRGDVQAGPGYLVVGRAPEGDNVGIDAVEVKGDRVWLALATDGPPRRVRVKAGDRELWLETGVGIELDALGDFRIVDPDNYATDDATVLRRGVLPVHYDRSLKALDAAMRIGWPTRWVERKDAWLVIESTGGDPAGEPVRGADCLPGPLFEGLLLDELVWERARTRSGPAGWLDWRGRVLVSRSKSWMPYEWWFGLPLERDWGDSATLAVLIERIKRSSLSGPFQQLPDPARGARFVNTKGVDRPWDGTTLPEGDAVVRTERNLAWILAAAAAAVLLVYLRAIVPA